MEFAPALFSTRVHKDKRTFYFDIKATKDGKPFMKITESTIDDSGEKKKTYMTVFNNELADFKAAINEACGFAEHVQ